MTLLPIHPSATELRIRAARRASGFDAPLSPRRCLIHLAVEAGYTFPQIGAQLRSGEEPIDEQRRRNV